MAQPVWTLSVDLQTKTATFQSGMADAARTARGSFNDIKKGAAEMGRETGFSAMEARHSVMMLGEEFGVHLPRALTSFIAHLGPLGPALQAAFPFLAVILGASLLVQHLRALKDEGEKLTESQSKFETAANNAFNLLDQKLLQAGIRADELNGNHLAALKKQLELIDHQSMAELVQAFGLVAKAADEVFKVLEKHWYSFGIGSEGAKHALTTFKTEYENLLSAGKDKEASDLLAGTRQSAEHVLAMMQQLKTSRADPIHGNAGDYAKYSEATRELEKSGLLSKVLHDTTEKELQAQQTLVETLKKQEEIQSRVNQLKGAEGANAKQATGNKMEDEAERVLKMQEDEARKEEEAAEREREERRRKAIEALQQGEREKIEATQRGSAERLAAIAAAIQEENGYGLQETGFYRGLLTQRVEVTRQMTDEQNRLAAEAGREQAEHTAKMAELALAADREQSALRRSAHRVTLDQIIADEVAAANKEHSIKMTAYAQEIAALDKHGKDYLNKLKALQNKEEQETKKHENQLTQIKDRAEKEQNQKTQIAYAQMRELIARGLTEVIMRHQSFAQMMASIGDQVLAGMLQNAIKSAMLLNFDREKEAAAAARHAYKWGWEHGGPAAPVLAVAMGAMAFAAEMAFKEGGIVPGVGSGDIVPAMLEPGEAVLPRQMTENLARAADTGRGGRISPTFHYRPTFNVSTVDASGVREMLTKHTQEFSRHFQNEMRRMNR